MISIEMVVSIALYAVLIALLSRFLNRIENNLVFAIILAFSITVILSGLVFNVLAVLEIYNKEAIIGMQCCFVLLLFVLNKRKSNICQWKIKISDLLIIGLIIFAGIWLFMHYRITYVLGDRDPFVYLMYAKKIAETGKLAYYPYLDSCLTDISAATFWTGELGTKVDYGFLPFSTVLFAFGYLVGGFKGATAINPVIAILSICIIYIFVVKHWKNRWIAGGAALLLLLNPATIWNARVTQSEMISQLILFTFLCLFYYAQKNALRTWGYFSVLILSCIHLARIDMYLCGLGFSLFMAYLCLWGKTEEKQQCFRYFFVYHVLLAAMFLLGAFSTPTYIFSHWNASAGQLKLLFTATLAVFSIVALFYLARKNRIMLKPIPFGHAPLLFIIGILSLTVVFAAYFVWSRNFFIHWFCNYSGEIIYFMFMVGIVLMLKRDEWKYSILFLFICGGNLILYLYDPNVAWDNLWISRRWVTLCIPFVVVCGSYGLYYMLKNKILFITICSVICFNYMIMSQGFMFTHVQDDLLDSEVELANHLSKNILYITDEQKVAWPLTYLFGYSVYKIAPCQLTGKAFGEYFEQYTYVYYIGNINRLEELCHVSFTYDMVCEYVLSGTSMPRMLNEIPMNREYYEFESNVYLLTGIGDAL